MDQTQNCANESALPRVLKPASRLPIPTAPKPAASSPNWQLIGATAHFTVYYDATYGTDAHTSAQAVLATCENDYANIQPFFGSQNANFTVYVGLEGYGTAYHVDCGATNIFCDFQHVNGDSSAPSLAPFLVAAEFVEVFEQMQGGGWNCGLTNGEGLSRVLAAYAHPYLALLTGSVGSDWLDSGRADYISANYGSDRDMASNGCSVLFLNWLACELGYSTYGWGRIVQAAGSSLAQTYTRLTGKTDAVQRFQSLMQARFPAGTPSNLTMDNPYPIQGLHVLYVKGDGSVALTTRHLDGS